MRADTTPLAMPNRERPGAENADMLMGLPRRAAPLLRGVLLMAGLLVAYAVVPIRRGDTFGVAGVIVFVAGLLALAVSVLLLARKELHAASDGGEGARLEILVAVLWTIVIFFALAYLRLGSENGQFAGLHTRIDALYFTMTTLTTVGYGDVHAVGQAARIVVTVQLVFDVVFVAVALRVLAAALARRRSTGSAK